MFNLKKKLREEFDKKAEEIKEQSVQYEGRISEEAERAKAAEAEIKKSVEAESERAKIKEDNISQSLDEAKLLFDNKITAEYEVRSNKDNEL